MRADLDFADGILPHCPKLADFLYTTGSLTALLEKQANKPLSVQVLSEGFVPLSYAQKLSLGLPVAKAQLAWQRSVLLYGSDDKPWVAAVSIFPLSALTGKLKRLKNLGKTPIGHLLFAKRPPAICHRKFYNKPYKNDHTITRDTCYQAHGAKILISEQFLPAFISHLKRHTI